MAGLLYGYRAHDNSWTFSEALHGLLASCSSYRTTCPLIHSVMCLVCLGNCIVVRNFVPAFKISNREPCGYGKWVFWM